MEFEAHCMSFPCTTLIIQRCQGKYSFPFYGTFKYDISKENHIFALSTLILSQHHLASDLILDYANHISFEIGNSWLI